MSGKLALVTGASGFIAGHIVYQLLERGYRVRGTARGAKAETLGKTIDLPGLEFVQVDNILNGDFTEALKGVDMLFHVASPVPSRDASVDDVINGAVEGSLNVLRQAEKAGIEKIVVTSSIAAILDPYMKLTFTGINITESSWGEVTIDEARANADNPFFVYFASKILAEKAVWEFARQHPKVDIATILPAFVYGPYAPKFPFPSKENLGTNAFPYSLITGKVPPNPNAPQYIVDVRDVAKAHVLAAELPRASPGEKRFTLNWGVYPWKEAAQNVKKTHPDLNVIDPADLPDDPPVVSSLDSTRSREVLKLEYTSPEKTLDDFVKSIAEVEKFWSRDV